MKKKIFLSFLALCLALSLCSVTAFADTGDSADESGDTAVTLQSQIDNATETEITVNVNSNTIESITIPSGKTVNLVIADGVTLTNENDKDTITVKLGGTLIVTGGGKVDNTSHGKGALFNNGTAELKGCTFDRSLENGSGSAESGGNSWYTICNHGAMIIDGAIVTTAGGGDNLKTLGRFSSLVENGYYTYTSTNNRDGYVAGTNSAAPSLLIKSGTFSGGINTVKNDDGAILTIEGGEFNNFYQAMVQNHNVATIKGGVFTAAADANTQTYGVDNHACGAEIDLGTLTIEGGTFSGATYAVYDRSVYGTSVTISGGNFSGATAAVYNTGSSKAAITVTGGSFSSDVSAFLPEDEDTEVSVEYVANILREANCRSGVNGIGKKVTVENGVSTTSYYVIPFAHTPGEAVRENEVAANCTEDGSYDSVVYCTVCEQKISRETIVVEATGHTEPTDESEITVVQPTCGEDGSKTYTCAVCGEEVTEVIPATGEHRYGTIETVVLATCTEPVKIGFTCEVCGQEDPERPLVDQSHLGAATGHDWQLDADSSENVAATCTEDGVAVYNCANCGETKTEVIPATGHTEGEPEHVPATCTENGKSVVKCTVCNEILEEIDLGELDPATGHDPEIIPAVAATCSQPGLTEGVKCSVCDEIIVAQEATPLDPNNHTFGEEPSNTLKAATCTTTGIGRYTCTGCGATKYATIPAAHSWDDGVETKPANCGEDGVKTYTCTVCEETKTEVIPATGAHNYEEDIVEATCTEPIKIVEKCTVCDAIGKVLSTVGEAKGHSYVEEVTKPATCTEDGEKTYTCSVCDDTYVEVIPATGHTAGEPEYVPANCTENGKYVVKCTVCGETVNEDDLGELDPAIGHNPETVEDIEPTCVTAGRTGQVVCSVCGEVLEEGEEIPATGIHTPEKVEGYAATCSETGLTDGERCSVCGEVLVAQEEIPVDENAHNYELTNTLKEATCSATGIGRYTCSICGKYQYGIIDKTDHTWDETSAEVTKEASCTEEGILTVTCTVCGATEERPIEALDHLWSEDKVGEKDGVNYVYKECERCGEIEIVEWIECPHENTELQGAKDASCTEDGYTGDFVCTVCGETVKDGEVIPALGHSWDDGEVTKAATATEDGEITYTCTVCGETKTEVIPATGEDDECVHEHTELRNAKEASCTEEGYTGDLVCLDCGTTVESGEVIPALGHSWDDGEVTKAATATEDGEITYTCTVCGETKTEVIPATGGDEECVHEHTELQNVKEASCTEDGYTGDRVCLDCGATVEPGEVIPALGHSWNDGEVTKEATATEDGEITYTCTVCGETKTEVIPATGEDEECAHEHTELQNVKEATCGEDGYTGDLVCLDCGTTVEPGEVIPATGKHSYEGVVNEDGSVTYTCTVCGDTFTESE